MHLAGDAGGIGQLKELVTENKEYLKFLVGEARSNADHATTFRGKNGVKYRIKLDLASGNLNVARDQDLYDFTHNIVNFGGATATGTISLSQRVYTITINWDDSRAANSANSRRSFVLTSRATTDPVTTP